MEPGTLNPSATDTSLKFDNHWEEIPDAKNFEQEIQRVESAVELMIEPHKEDSQNTEDKKNDVADYLTISPMVVDEELECCCTKNWVSQICILRAVESFKYNGSLLCEGCYFNYPWHDCQSCEEHQKGFIVSTRNIFRDTFFVNELYDEYLRKHMECDDTYDNFYFALKRVLRFRIDAIKNILLKKDIDAIWID